MPEAQNGSGQTQSHMIAYFSEQEMVQYSRLELPIIQHFVEIGMISSIEVAGKARRCYGAADLSLLRQVRRLYQDLGVNLEGIEIILRQNARIEMLQLELSRYHAWRGQDISSQQISSDDQEQPEIEEPPS